MKNIAIVSFILRSKDTINSPFVYSYLVGYILYYSVTRGNALTEKGGVAGDISKLDRKYLTSATFDVGFPDSVHFYSGDVIFVFGIVCRRRNILQ